MTVWVSSTIPNPSPGCSYHKLHYRRSCLHPEPYHWMRVGVHLASGWGVPILQVRTERSAEIIVAPHGCYHHHRLAGSPTWPTLQFGSRRGYWDRIVPHPDPPPGRTTESTLFCSLSTPSESWGLMRCNSTSHWVDAEPTTRCNVFLPSPSPHPHSIRVWAKLIVYHSWSLQRYHRHLVGSVFGSNTATILMLAWSTYHLGSWRGTTDHWRNLYPTPPTAGRYRDPLSPGCYYWDLWDLSTNLEPTWNLVPPTSDCSVQWGSWTAPPTPSSTALLMIWYATSSSCLIPSSSPWPATTQIARKVASCPTTTNPYVSPCTPIRIYNGRRLYIIKKKYTILLRLDMHVQVVKILLYLHYLVCLILPLLLLLILYQPILPFLVLPYLVQLRPLKYMVDMRNILLHIPLWLRLFTLLISSYYPSSTSKLVRRCCSKTITQSNHDVVSGPLPTWWVWIATEWGYILIKVKY